MYLSHLSILASYAHALTGLDVGSLSARSVRTTPQMIGGLAPPPTKTGGNGGNADAPDWKSQKDLCLNNLLLQRAIQSKLAHLRELRDDFKMTWLEKFRDHRGLADNGSGMRLGYYHGLNGLKGSWQPYLREMLRMPPEECEIHTKWGNKFAGGSKNNPYVTREVGTTYMQTVTPRTSATELIQIREQLAEEWRQDMKAMLGKESIIANAWHRWALAEQNEQRMAQEEGDTFKTVTLPLLPPPPPTVDPVTFRQMRSSSPLRRQNAELLCALLTRLAAAQLLWTESARPNLNLSIGNRRDVLQKEANLQLSSGRIGEHAGDEYIQYVVARGDPTLAIALMEERIKMVDEFCGCGGESGDGDCMLPLLDLVYQEHQKLLLATRTE